MDTHVDWHTLVMPNSGDIKWALVGLLQHINRANNAIMKCLHCFVKIALECEEAREITTQQMQAYGKGDLGKTFLLSLACFIFHINDDEVLSDDKNNVLTIGGPAKES